MIAKTTYIQAIIKYFLENNCILSGMEEYPVSGFTRDKGVIIIY